MKVIAIGDIHGRTIWKQIVEKEKDADKIIFIGDYLDSHEEITGTQQSSNFREILEYKKTNPTKVILLFGNHDYHYITTAIGEEYSGYQPVFALEFKELLDNAIKKNLVQMCYIQDFGKGNGKFLFSHAGITETWCKKWDVDIQNVEESINLIFKYKPLSFRFSGWDPYGNDVTQSPIWVRPESLMQDRIKGYIHVVGHTTQMRGINIKNEPNIILIDTLIVNEYLIIDNGELIVGKI